MNKFIEVLLKDRIKKIEVGSQLFIVNHHDSNGFNAGSLLTVKNIKSDCVELAPDINSATTMKIKLDGSVHSDYTANTIYSSREGYQSSFLKFLS